MEFKNLTQEQIDALTVDGKYARMALLIHEIDDWGFNTRGLEEALDAKDPMALQAVMEEDFMFWDRFIEELLWELSLIIKSLLP